MGLKLIKVILSYTEGCEHLYQRDVIKGYSAAAHIDQYLITTTTINYH